MREHATEARQKLLARLPVGALVILYAGEAPHKSLDQYYRYTPQRNFYYLTGLDAPQQILVMAKGEEKTHTWLFIEENTDHIIKWEGARMTRSEAAEISGISETDIYYLDAFEKRFNLLMNYARSPLGNPPKTLYLDLYHVRPDVTPVALNYAETIRKNYPELTIENVNAHLAYLRMFKTPYEIEQLRGAIDMTRKGLETVMRQCVKRSHEYQLEADFLHTITEAGSTGNAFETIAASGGNATVLHYVSNRSPLSKEQLILLDLGALNGPYAADISRTYPINGKFTDRQRVLYEIVLEVNKATIAMVKPGVTWAALNAFARDLLIEKAKEIGLIKEDHEISQLYYHSIGHFLGLDVHDVGLYDLPLQAGMVLTIEPGLYVAEENIGIRIEDDILVTEDGAINLSADIIKEVEDIETFMKHAS